jgi:hypothetical protein
MNMIQQFQTKLIKQMMNKNTKEERHKKDGLNLHMLEDKPNLLPSYLKKH